MKFYPIIQHGFFCNLQNFLLADLRFYDYIHFFVVRKLNFAIQLIQGSISDISETDEKQQKEPIPTGNVSINVSINADVNVSIKNRIVEIMMQMPSITVKELAKMLSVTERTINRQIDFP